MTSSVVLVTGGFDPIHSGHISLLTSAKQIAPLSALAVGLNSDYWLTKKKGQPFLPLEAVSYTHLTLPTIYSV